MAKEKILIDDAKLKADVRELLYERGMKLDSLAEAIGYSDSSVYKYLNMKNGKSVPVAKAIIDYFGLRIDDYTLKEK